MTLEELDNNIESAISEYQSLLVEETIAFDRMRMAMESEDMDARVYQYRIQAIREREAQVKSYLNSANSSLNNLTNDLERKETQLNASIPTFGEMAKTKFGSSANEKVAELQSMLNECVGQRKYAYTLIDRIDSALNGSNPTTLSKARTR